MFVFYDTRDEAQADLDAILADEPEWDGLIQVVALPPDAEVGDADER